MNLITGATGLVGAHLALTLLQQGQSVKATKRYNSDVLKTKKLFNYYTTDYENLFNKIIWVEADINDIYTVLDALEGVDTVYHCAGYVSFEKKEWHNLQKINVDGTANIVNACIDKKIKVLCHVSSIATISNADVTKNISETVFWKSSPTQSLYAISKYNGEREVWRGIEEGLNAVIVNPGIILGPGFWQTSSGKVFNTCYKGLPFYTKGTSAYVDARDVAECMVKCVEQKLFNNRYILIENNYTFKQSFDIILNKFGKKLAYINANKIVLKFAQFFNYINSTITGKAQVITSDTINGALEQNTYSNKKILTATNHQFISFDNSVEFCCNAYLNDLKNV